MCVRSRTRRPNLQIIRRAIPPPPHEVVETFALIPPAAFVASGLGAWRRAVLALTQEPGADVCKAYLRVAFRVVSSAEAIRDEQARAAGDAASGSAGA